MHKYDFITLNNKIFGLFLIQYFNANSHYIIISKKENSIRKNILVQGIIYFTLKKCDFIRRKNVQINEW